MPAFDLEGARREGHSDEEIQGFLQQQFPKFQFAEAQQEGHSLDEISQFLSTQDEKPGPPSVADLAKDAGKTALQFGIGLAENALLPSELATIPQGNEEAQLAQYREFLSDDLERLMDQKFSGVWDQDDQAHLDNVIEQMKNPAKSEEFIQTVNLGVQGLAESATGLDLTPEGASEKAARWVGWIKNPKNLVNLAKAGVSKKEIAKAVLPTGTEAFRGVAAGNALQFAEEGNLGPIGTLAAGVAADLGAAGIAGAAKSVGRGAIELFQNPKQFAAEALASFSDSEKQALQKSIIEDFRASGIQADLGTTTNNNLVKWVQSRLAQSGLTGESLDNLKNQITSDIKGSYSEIADTLGEIKHTTAFEAGEAGKDFITRVRDIDLDQVRGIYQAAETSLEKDARVFTDKLSKEIARLKETLTPGAIKSTEQKAVLDALEKIESDLLKTHPEGRTGFVKDLINNKVALNDIINFEVQGGAKKLLKGIVGELDRAIISHGGTNPKFAKNYVAANKRFAQHAKTFRNKNISAILKTQDPAQAFNKMNTVQGIRDIKNALSSFPEGAEAFNQLKRFKLDQIIGDNLIDSTTKQVKLGTFSKLLEKGKNRELVKELIGPKEFKKLELIQRNAGHLAEASQKFFNASQSGVVATDAAVILKGLNALTGLLHGNPWPLAKVLGGVNVAKRISGMLSNPEFMRSVEDVILANKSGSKKRLNSAMKSIAPFMHEILQESAEASALLSSKQALDGQEEASTLDQSIGTTL